MQQVATTVRRLSSRERQTGDWKAIYDLCCRTGDNGQPIAPERCGFFGRFWVGPYEKILPGWTYVAEGGGVIIGYLTGCPDSRGFARAKVRHFVLPFLVDIFRGSAASISAPLIACTRTSSISSCKSAEGLRRM